MGCKIPNACFPRKVEQGRSCAETRERPEIPVCIAQGATTEASLFVRSPSPSQALNSAISGCSHWPIRARQFAETPPLWRREGEDNTVLYAAAVGVAAAPFLIRPPGSHPERTALRQRFMGLTNLLKKTWERANADIEEGERTRRWSAVDSLGRWGSALINNGGHVEPHPYDPELFKELLRMAVNAVPDTPRGRDARLLAATILESVGQFREGENNTLFKTARELRDRRIKSVDIRNLDATVALAKGLAHKLLEIPAELLVRVEETPAPKGKKEDKEYKYAATQATEKEISDLETLAGSTEGEVWKAPLRVARRILDKILSNEYKLSEINPQTSGRAQQTLTLVLKWRINQNDCSRPGLTPQQMEDVLQDLEGQLERYVATNKEKPLKERKPLDINKIKVLLGERTLGTRKTTSAPPSAPTATAKVYEFKFEGWTFEARVNPAGNALQLRWVEKHGEFRGDTLRMTYRNVETQAVGRGKITATFPPYWAEFVSVGIDRRQYTLDFEHGGLGYLDAQGALVEGRLLRDEPMPATAKVAARAAEATPAKPPPPPINYEILRERLNTNPVARQRVLEIAVARYLDKLGQSVDVEGKMNSIHNIVELWRLLEKVIGPSSGALQQKPLREILRMVVANLGVDATDQGKFEAAFTEALAIEWKITQEEPPPPARAPAPARSPEPAPAKTPPEALLQAVAKAKEIEDAKKKHKAVAAIEENLARISENDKSPYRTMVQTLLGELGALDQIANVNEDMKPHLDDLKLAKMEGRLRSRIARRANTGRVTRLHNFVEVHLRDVVEKEKLTTILQDVRRAEVLMPKGGLRLLIAEHGMATRFDFRATGTWTRTFVHGLKDAKRRMRRDNPNKQPLADLLTAVELLSKYAEENPADIPNVDAALVDTLNTGMEGQQPNAQAISRVAVGISDALGKAQKLGETKAEVVARGKGEKTKKGRERGSTDFLDRFKEILKESIRVKPRRGK